MKLVFHYSVDFVVCDSSLIEMDGVVVIHRLVEVWKSVECGCGRSRCHIRLDVVGNVGEVGDLGFD